MPKIRYIIFRLIVPYLNSVCYIRAYNWATNPEHHSFTDIWHLRGSAEPCKQELVCLCGKHSIYDRAPR